MCWMCDHPEATFEDYVDEEVWPLVDRCGWFLQLTAGRGGRVPYAYTVGLTGRGLPELVVSGKTPAAAGDLIEAVLAEGAPQPGRPFDVLLGPALQVVGVRSTGWLLPVAVALYGPRVQAVQLVWADAAGRWPGERGAPEQEVLGSVRRAA